MAQSLNRRANSLLLMDTFAMWEHPDSLLRRTGVTNTQGGDLSAERRVPAVEVAESGGNLIVSAELPGLWAEDVKVETIGSLQIIQGEHRPERGPQTRGHGPERRPRYFYREIVLPDEADGHNAPAEIHNRLLRIITSSSGATNPDRYEQAGLVAAETFMKPLLIIAIVCASFVLGANMPVSHGARATQSTDNNSDTAMPACTASVPAKWGPIKGVSAVYGLGFEDASGTLRFVNKFPCGFDTTPPISLELHRK